MIFRCGACKNEVNEYGLTYVGMTTVRAISIILSGSIFSNGLQRLRRIPKPQGLICNFCCHKSSLFLIPFSDSYATELNEHSLCTP
jgi:hypothetical protein